MNTMNEQATQSQIHAIYQRRRIVFVFGLVVLGLLLAFVSNQDTETENVISMNDLAQDIRDERVEIINVVNATDVIVAYTDGSTALVFKDASSHLFAELDTLDVPGSAMEKFIYIESED